MDHIYHNMMGWFSFPDLYSEMVKRFDKGTFVEIGTFEGKSFSFLIVEVINSGKPIRCIGVDAFPWADLLPRFIENLRPLEGHYEYIKADSWEAAKEFEDHSVQFVFIDANHTYEYVKKDIEAWLPKIAPGGVIAGHDYNEQWLGLCQAVQEIFGNRIIENKKEGTWQVNC